jgi:hypothetical protein
MPDRRAMMITMETPEGNDYYGSQIPETTSREVRMRIKLGCLYAEQIGENKTKIIFVVSADGNIVKFI